MSFENIESTDKLNPTSRDKINNNFDKCLEITNNLSDVSVPNTALNNILPSQSSANGKVLKSNGTNASWETEATQVIATASVLGAVKTSVAPVDAGNPIAVGDNDNRVSPVSLATVTTNIVGALAGTGTPNGTTGKYVTNDDTSATSSANKVYRQTAAGKIDATMLAGNLPALDGSALTGVIQYKNGVAERVLSASDGTVNYAHGLGKIPKNVRITCFFFLNSTSIQVSSYGVYNGTTTACVFSGVSTALQNDTSTTKIIHVADQGVSNSYAEASITVDATNIMLAWTKTNSPTATVKFIWEVEG